MVKMRCQKKRPKDNTETLPWSGRPITEKANEFIAKYKRHRRIGSHGIPKELDIHYHVVLESVPKKTVDV